eukprot:TRINITY_DN331_c0_g1_i1.p1 TRINITY_DN331_c0_g1~~TRINITY_DN331_c0_g1_i1.p1  ORF type:complete len:259 (-),score=40.00 TRINITY_DN331_c0_g1_i1:46-822(-)
MKGALAVCLAELVFILVASGQDCSTTAPDGSKYNLDALANFGYINGVDDKNEWNYTVKVCGDTIPCIQTNDPNVCSSGAGYCQHSNTLSQTYCVGLYIPPMVGLDNGAGVQLIYQSPRQGRMGVVTITCNPGGPLVSGVVAISPFVVSGYKFYFNSSAACPYRDCPGIHTCDECSSSENCKWCLDSNTCVQSDNTQCSNWINNPSFCSSTCQYPSCDQCCDSGCFWCLGQKQCTIRTRVCEGGAIHNSTYCPLESKVF